MIDMPASISPWVKTLSDIQRLSTPYIYSAYIIFGTFGCSLTVLLLSFRRKFRTVTCCIYLAAASFAMAISLSFSLGMSLYMINPTNAASLPCFFPRIQTYVNQVVGMSYRWLLVAASFDRYALSSAQVKLRNFATMRIARRTILVIIIACIILGIYNLLFDVRNPVKVGLVYNTTVLYYHSIFTVVVGFILPASTMIIFAFCTYHNLVVKRSRQVMMAHNIRNNAHIKRVGRKRDNQVLLLLLVQAIVFAITVIPLMAYHSYNACALNIRNKSDERLKIEDFALFCALLGVNLFPTLSFYLYTMSSRMFRVELVCFFRSILLYISSIPNNRVGSHNFDTRPNPVNIR